MILYRLSDYKVKFCFAISLFTKSEVNYTKPMIIELLVGYRFTVNPLYV